MSTPISTYNGPAEVAALTLTGLKNGVKVYRALITQHNGLSATATVLENSLGGVPAYTYINTVGNYFQGTQITLANAFPAGKTFIRIDNATDTTFSAFDVGTYVASVWVSSSTINIYSFNVDQGGIVNNWMRNAPLEILVYP